MTKTNLSGENTYRTIPTYFNKFQVKKSFLWKGNPKNIRENWLLAASTLRVIIRAYAIASTDFLSRITDRWSWIIRMVQATCLTSVHFLNLNMYATCSSLLSER